MQSSAIILKVGSRRQRLRKTFLVGAQPESLAIETTVGNLIVSLPETGPEVLIGALDYGDREFGIINSHNPLAAVWGKWNYYAHESEVRLHVDANNFGESHGERCVCQEPESRWIEFGRNAFSRVYAHPKMGEDLFEAVRERVEAFDGGLGVERAGVRA